MRYDINWEAAYDAYLASDLNVTAFTRRGLGKFNNSATRPSVGTVRSHFKRIAKEREKAAAAPRHEHQPTASKASSKTRPTLPATTPILISPTPRGHRHTA